MRTALVAVGMLLSSAFPSTAQSVPEGVHTLSDGPSEMCGIVGADASDLVVKARQSRDLRAVSIPSDRFGMFESPDSIRYQLIVTLPSEPAHPAASCRELYEEDGVLRMKRSMRCDAGRAECDALFLEFQALDLEVARALRTESQ